jgi:lysophospholipase L1-like esterase
VANVEPFVFKANGSPISGPTDLPIGGIAFSGYQVRYGESDGTGNSNVSITFGPFTGNTFNIIYGVDDTAYVDYTIFANGVNIAANTFGSANVGGDAGVTNNSNNNRRAHSFTYVRNASIELRSRRPSASNTRFMRINAFEFPKKIRITNQGISGSSARVYVNNCLSGSFAPPRAIGAQDNFVFMQLGTNDRIISGARPNGVSGFRMSLKGLIADLVANSQTVIMCSLPSENNDPNTYSFSMQECRDTLMKEAKKNNLDFIDNFAVFPRDKMDYDIWTDDGLHPNVRGHYRIYRNIVGSLEQA